MDKKIKVYAQYLGIVFILMLVYTGIFTNSTANKVSTDLTHEHESFNIEKEETETNITIQNENRYTEIDGDNKKSIKQKLQTTPYVLTENRISTINKNLIGYTYLEVKYSHLDKDNITSRDIATYIKENKLKVIVSSIIQSGVIINFILYYTILIAMLYVLLKVAYQVVPKIRIRVMHGKKASKMMEAASRYLLKKGLNVEVIIFYTTLIVGILALQSVAMGFDLMWQLQICLFYIITIILIICFEVYRIDRKSKKIED